MRMSIRFYRTVDSDLISLYRNTSNFKRIVRLALVNYMQGVPFEIEVPKNKINTDNNTILFQLCLNKADDVPIIKFLGTIKYKHRNDFIKNLIRKDMQSIPLYSHFIDEDLAYQNELKIETIKTKTQTTNKSVTIDEKSYEEKDKEKVSSNNTKKPIKTQKAKPFTEIKPRITVPMATTRITNNNVDDITSEEEDAGSSDMSIFDSLMSF